MQTPKWMRKKGITLLELVKVSATMGLLMFLVGVMLIGAIGANI